MQQITHNTSFQLVYISTSNIWQDVVLFKLNLNLGANMFDVSMSELGMVVVVALLVMKPQDLRDSIRYIRRMKEGVHSQYHSHKKKFQEEIADLLGEEDNGVKNNESGYIIDMHGTPQDTYTLDDVMPFIKKRRENKSEQQE
ncbi:MAG: hypothetical protein JSS50_05415 [Proteobacteria bacterium]|nr:hypothetical protein [Pseudomonadota bacterium]